MSIDILKKCIKNRFQDIVSIFKTQSNHNLYIDLYIQMSIFLEEFLDYPEKGDMEHFLNFLDSIKKFDIFPRTDDYYEYIYYHSSILKRDIEIFYDNFYEKLDDKKLKEINSLKKQLLDKNKE